MTSYRPISNLSKLSLSFERILLKYLHQIVHNKIYKHQYGFVKKKYTVQLIIFLEDIHQDIDNNRSAYCAYLDFNKAFDKVQHNLLLAKLRKLGIGGMLLKLIVSYLSGRYECVKFCNTLVIINLRPVGCPGFADDSTLINIPSLTEFQLDLNNCLKWGNNNAMEFNSIRTSSLNFGTNTSTLFIKCAHDTIMPSELVEDIGRCLFYREIKMVTTFPKNFQLAMDCFRN